MLIEKTEVTHKHSDLEGLDELDADAAAGNAGTLGVSQGLAVAIAHQVSMKSYLLTEFF
jgi:hypothetical protein